MKLDVLQPSCQHKGSLSENGIKPVEMETRNGARELITSFESQCQAML